MFLVFLVNFLFLFFYLYTYIVLRQTNNIKSAAMLVFLHTIVVDFYSHFFVLNFCTCFCCYNLKTRNIKSKTQHNQPQIHGGIFSTRLGGSSALLCCVYFHLFFSCHISSSFSCQVFSMLFLL